MVAVAMAAMVAMVAMVVAMVVAIIIVLVIQIIIHQEEIAIMVVTFGMPHKNKI